MNSQKSQLLSSAIKFGFNSLAELNDRAYDYNDRAYDLAGANNETRSDIDALVAKAQLLACTTKVVYLLREAAKHCDPGVSGDDLRECMQAIAANRNEFVFKEDGAWTQE